MTCPHPRCDCAGRTRTVCDACQMTPARIAKQIAILEARVQDLYRDIAALRAMAKGAKR